MLIFGHNYKERSKSKGYDCENATFVKYGKEIKIHDFIQEGKEGTEANELVKNAGGLKQLKGALEKIPSSDTVIDLNMDIIQANKILKAGQVAQKKLDRQAKIAEELAKIENKKIENPQQKGEE